MDEHAALLIDAFEPEGLIEPLFATSRSREGYLVSLVSSPPLALREPGGCDETYRCADLYLNVLYPETRLLPETVMWVRASKDGGFERLLGVQHVAGFWVIGSMIDLQMSDRRLSHLSGRWLPSDFVESAGGLDFSPEDLLDQGIREWGGSLLGYGIFHGSIFQEEGFEYDKPVPAFVVAGTDADASRILVVEAGTGRVLRSEPGVLSAEFDTWQEVDLSYPPLTIHYPDPQTVLMLDTQQVCGGSNPPPYPDCNYWPAHTFTVRHDVAEFDAFVRAKLDRDGWDDGKLNACPSGSPYCCALGANGPFDPHAYSFAANSILRPFFSRASCLTVYHEAFSCPSVIGHEYGHGMDFSEKRIASNCTQTNICAAMGEGFSDIVGSAFTQLWGAYEGDPWIINDEYIYCEPVRDLSNPVPPQADHASNYNFWNGDPHDNAFVLSYGFYLLARTPQEGAKEHYGVSVTGIGIEKAFRIYYDAFTKQIPSHQNPSFSDLRLALLMAAQELFGYQSNEYFQTRKTVDAMGYWTTPTFFPQRFSGQRPDLGRFGTFGNALLQYPTVVYMEDGKLKYRYRYYDYGSHAYRWSYATQIAQSTGSFHVLTVLRRSFGVPLGYDIHVYYQDSSYYLRHYTRPYSGQPSDRVVYRNGVPLRLAPNSKVRIVKHGETYWIFYAPYGITQIIMSAIDVSNDTVGSGSVDTGVSAGVNNFEVGSDGNSLHIFYRPYVAGTILQKKWGGRTFVDVPPETSPLGNYSDVVLERAVFGGQDRGVVYVRCDSGCDAPEKWSNVNPIGPVLDNSPLNGTITLAKDFTTEGGLTFGRQRPDNADPMWYVTKFSK